MPKISALPTDTAPIGEDRIPFLDLSAARTESVSLDELATSRAFTDRYAPVLVVDSATYGDGVTDASAHIQAKIDEVVAAGGGTIVFPVGIYRCTTTLVVNERGVRMVGMGALETVNGVSQPTKGSIIQAATGLTILLDVNNTGVAFDGFLAENLHFTEEGTARTSTLVRCSDVNHGVFLRCNFHLGAVGLVWNDAGASDASWGRASQCNWTQNTIGCQLSGGVASNLIDGGSIFADFSGSKGVYCSSAGHIRIIGMKLDGAAGSNILDLLGSTYTEVLGCNFEMFGNSVGIQAGIGALQGLDIGDCTFYQNGAPAGRGVEILSDVTTPALNVKVVDSHFFNLLMGVDIRAYTTLTILDSLTFDGTTTCISIAANANKNIIDNIASDTTYAATIVNSGSNTEIGTVVCSDRVLTTALGREMILTEVTAPASPPTDHVVVFARDNGAGKTELCALFPTGVVQQLAIEP